MEVVPQADQLAGVQVVAQVEAGVQVVVQVEAGAQAGHQDVKLSFKPRIPDRILVS